MSWNNIIHGKVVECMMLCKERETEDGYVIHVPECPIGKEIKERERTEDISKPITEPGKLRPS